MASMRVAAAATAAPDVCVCSTLSAVMRRVSVDATGPLPQFSEYE